MKFVNGKRVTPANGEDSQLSAKFRNPFMHELRLTALQKVKIAVMTVTLFPVRLLFAAFMMLLAWPFAFVATVGLSEDAVEPLSWWRWLVDLALKAIMRAMWFSGGFHWVRVKGRPALPSEAPILTLAPHSSYFDAIPVTMTMASIVMKAESKDIPVWGTLIKFIRPVFVSRSDQDSRRKTVEEIKRRAFSAGEWPQIMIFPEGTCTNRSCLIAFKPGAFIPGVPVQPVVLRYPNEVDTISWTWQGPGAFKILWLTLCQLHNSIEIEYLPTYTPSEVEKRDPALFASNVRRIMAKALHLPIIDYSFEDCQLAMAKGPLCLPSHTCLLEFSRLVRRLGLKVGVTDQILQEESGRARRLCGGKISLESFAKYVNLPVTETLQDVFALFEEHGQMDVREYVIALSVVCRPFRHLDTIQLAFRMFEAEEDGAIVEDELAVILKTALGVADLTACDVFRAVDTEDKGKITCDDFRRFMERCPNFVELYCCFHHLATLACSEHPEPITNSFCSDFSLQEQTTSKNSNSKKHD
ncbi:lysophosphatidylcholine acyltransferase 1 [Pygocentrus nattereri]|uniref:EF-hand domain-containing protein n=1 Tax=Pygocentrus nattereri TaxID=42514 RepID=A0A3B4DH39_PYGNA|nr:lysophosphatidylcholine acyltransferase 1 [Pygocentrus nattereri]